jgi:hypothetical protein
MKYAYCDYITVVATLVQQVEGSGEVEGMTWDIQELTGAACMKGKYKITWSYPTVPTDYRAALREIQQGWGACGDDYVHETGLGLYEYIGEVLK